MKNYFSKYWKLLFLFMFPLSTVYSQVNMQEGMRLIKNEKYEKAKQFFNSILSRDAKNARVYYYLGTIYENLSLTDSAKSAYQQGINADAKEPLNYIGLAGLAIDNHDSVQSKSLSEKALALANPKDVEVPVEMARAYLTNDKKDPDQALTLLNKALAIDKNNTRVYILMGDAYLLKNDGGQALTNYERAGDIDKFSAESLVRIGKVYVRMRNMNDAMNYFQNAIKLDPEYPPSYQQLGEVYYTEKQLDKAKEAYKKYIDLSDNKSNARTRYASFLFLTKDYANTVNEINEVLKTDKNNYIMYRLLGYSAFETNDFPAAVSSLEKFFSMAPKTKIFVSDYEYYGKALIKSGHDSLGIVNLRKTMEMDSSKTELYTPIAEALVKMKNLVEAAKEYELAIKTKKNPTTQDFYTLGKIYYTNKDLVKADSIFTIVTTMQPNWPVGHLYRARINANLDPESDKGLAKPFYEQFIEKALPDSAKFKNELKGAYAYLGYYYYITKEFSNSKIYWLKVQEIDAEDQQAKDALKELKNF